MPDPGTCQVCDKTLNPLSVKRGATRCKSCAAKARGMPPALHVTGGKARAAQLAEQARLARLAQERGLG